ncbi:hypothetical protein [Haloarchaeobius sp. DYHT-AS-18]|uniref:hypothetical protein n=1 Tax=Haloarchaeobius sp. DYHT-AS-18 TaxID=3446117 RepID=UPI003EBB4607
MEPDVCAAIQANRMVEFEYDGVGRVVEPFYHGTTRFDEELLCGYQRPTAADQTGGSDDVGGAAVADFLTTGDGWRVYDVNRIADLRLTDRSFPGNRAVPADVFQNSLDHECCRL